MACHNELSRSDQPFARRVEIAYMPESDLTQFRPGQRHPTLGQGETLCWTQHRSNWILERWILREHGVAVLGPEPASILDPLSRDEILKAVRERLADWVAWAAQPEDPDWQLPRSHKAYVVETMCRALCTLSTGEISSKPASVSWALSTLPEPWRRTVALSQGWREDRYPDPSIAPMVRAFIEMAGAQARHSSGSGSQE